MMAVATEATPATGATLAMEGIPPLETADTDMATILAAMEVEEADMDMGTILAAMEETQVRESTVSKRAPYMETTLLALVIVRTPVPYMDMETPVPAQTLVRKPIPYVYMETVEQSPPAMDRNGRRM